MRKIRKGDIFLVDLNPVIGHEQGGFRPVVVVQNNIANDILNTVMVAPLTSNPKAAGYLLTAQIDAKKLRFRTRFSSIVISDTND